MSFIGVDISPLLAVMNLISAQMARILDNGSCVSLQALEDHISAGVIDSALGSSMMRVSIIATSCGCKTFHFDLLAAINDF